MPGLQLWPKVRPSQAPPYVPTPTEIRVACELIRGEWSREEHVYRLRVDWRPGEWELPNAIPSTIGEWQSYCEGD